jgi:hypothetical protein
MVDVVNTIIPIFVVILLGVLLRRMDFLPPAMLGPLNKLVFYLAIPAMIFRKIAGASFQEHFQPLMLSGTLLPVVAVFGLAAWIVRMRRIPGQVSGTFVQSSFHGNLGYIGLAVCFYFLGDQGLTRASILAGFLMLLQNLLSVIGLQAASSTHATHQVLFVVRKVLLNPVIVSAGAGILFSLFGLPLPVIVTRSLDIVSGMALPLALLVIGASLSFSLIREHFRLALWTGGLKLMVLPFLGLLIFKAMALEPEAYAPGLILLAAPTATVTYVMAGEMRGSPDLASATVALNTILSALSYLLWLSLI